MRLFIRVALTATVLLGASGLALGLAHCFAGQPPPSSLAASGATAPRDAWPVGDTERVWSAPHGLVQEPIWPGEPPDLVDAPAKPETVRVAKTPDALTGDRSESVLNISRPTMTIYPPKGRNTGAAIVVFPGGGFRVVAITLEGTEVCDWITARGVTCILSKYRVPGSNHYWDPQCRCVIDPKPPRALQDAQRTIRLVRMRAASLGVDPNKIGVMGFSAGGYLVAQTSNIFESSYAPVDGADRVSSRPDFAIAFFPGHLCRDGALDPGLRVTARTPPTFLVQSWDDPVDPICNSTLYAQALDDANVSTEVHLFAHGGHAFALRRHHSPDTVWPGLLENWLAQIGVLSNRSP